MMATASQQSPRLPQRVVSKIDDTVNRKATSHNLSLVDHNMLGSQRAAKSCCEIPLFGLSRTRKQAIQTFETSAQHKRREWKAALNTHHQRTMGQSLSRARSLPDTLLTSSCGSFIAALHPVGGKCQAKKFRMKQATRASAEQPKARRERTHTRLGRASIKHSVAKGQW